jgi:hypothetical protein
VTDKKRKKKDIFSTEKEATKIKKNRTEREKKKKGEKN